MIELTQEELSRCNASSGVLRALADEHEGFSLEAESIGMDHYFRHHDNRANQLRAEADRLDSINP